MANVIKMIIIGIIKFYQQAISPWKNPCCRFIPSCSEYAVLAIEKHGPAKGLMLSARRLLKCHPFHSGGYDPVYANQDLDRVLPLDVLREMEKGGEIGSLHDFYYTTVGNGTSVANSKKFATEIAADLKAANVDAVILTST